MAVSVRGRRIRVSRSVWGARDHHPHLDMPKWKAEQKAA